MVCQKSPLDDRAGFSQFDNTPKVFLDDSSRGYEIEYLDPTERTRTIKRNIHGNYITARTFAQSFAHKREAIFIDITSEARKKALADASPYVRRLLEFIGNMSEADFRRVLAS